MGEIIKCYYHERIGNQYKNYKKYICRNIPIFNIRLLFNWTHCILGFGNKRLHSYLFYFRISPYRETHTLRERQNTLIDTHRHAN